MVSLDENESCKAFLDLKLLIRKSMETVIKRLPDLMAASGLARSTLYLRIKSGLWTRAVSLGGRAVGWPRHEVSAILGARLAGKSDAEIRILVDQLHADRKNG